MPITEPMTLVTDYLLAVLVFYFAVRLLGLGRHTGQLSVRLWAGAFLASAVAGVAGGTYHGFFSRTPGFAGIFLWKITVFAIGLAGLYLLAAATLATLTGKPRRWLLLAGLLEFLFYVVWMTTHDEFRYVIYDYAPLLLVVLVLQSIRLGKDESAPWVIGGILVSFGAAGVQASGLKLHEYFNHNDLYHLVQMVAFYLLFRGGRLFRDR